MFDLFPASVNLPSGEKLLIRLMEKEDTAQLALYLTHLSDKTKQFFAPHPFDPVTLQQIGQSLDHQRVLRIIAVESRHNRIVAYTLVLWGVLPNDARRFETHGVSLSPQTDCTLAPSVADAYQSQGLGSLLMTKVMAAARAMRKSRIVLWGGVQAGNEKAVSFYEKFGFTRVGTFNRHGNNYNMLLAIKVSDG